ncbi:unnamed protein product [Hydatigera taeniaeformis]|uniref:E3 ubiquitin protein ligase n=1 Tax=Hydatigena taeniaeformis TaxID=6205 RepID=A0A0R3X092_HYDTA|nr:unnamed protein product [Hydatigera taeniaeformis]
MQRTPRQNKSVISKDKIQASPNMHGSMSSLPTRHLVNTADLEGRVAAAEKLNQQILRDISDLKEELQLSRNRFSGMQTFLDQSVVLFKSKISIKHLLTFLLLAHPSSRGPKDNLDSNASLNLTPPPQQSKLRPPNTLPIGDIPSQSNMDRAIQKLSADLQTVNSRCGSQALDIQNLYQELRNFDLKLENTLRSELRCLQAEMSSNFAHSKSNSPNKCDGPEARGSGSSDGAVQRLEGAVAQMERKMEQLQSDRLRFENAVQNNLLDQATRSSETDKNTKETIAELRSKLKNNAQEIISSRQDAHSELEDLSDQLNHRVTDSLEKLQCELNNSRRDLEAVSLPEFGPISRSIPGYFVCLMSQSFDFALPKALSRINVANSAYEARLVEVENGLKKLTKELPEEMHELRQDHQTHQKKLLSSLTQLDLAVEVLEQGLSDEKEQLKGVVAAEIKARTSNIFTIQTKLQELEESTKEASLKFQVQMDEIQGRLTQITSQVG